MNINYCDVSAKSGKGVDEAFVAFAKDIYNTHQ